MKTKKYLIILATVLTLVLISNIVSVGAAYIGFSTEKLSEKDRENFISNIDISPLTKQPIKREIQCFDVGDDGRIAIGQKSEQKKEICIYSPDGTFLYGYAFNCSQSFGVELNGENINIYFVRSDIIITVDRSENILEAEKVQNTIENNDYENKLLYSTERTVGGTKYSLKNDYGIFNVFATSFSKLVATSSSGEEYVVYEAGTNQFLNIIIMLLLVVTAFVTVAVILIKRLKANR